MSKSEMTGPATMGTEDSPHSRRSFLTHTVAALTVGGAANAVATTASQSSSIVAPVLPDPIFTAIERHKGLMKAHTDLCTLLDEAEFAARNRSGESRPSALIA